MTIAAEFEVPIGRSPDAVWAELSAIERYPEWLAASGIAAVRRLDPGPLVPGARFGIEQRIAGQARTLEGRVTAIEAGRRLAFEAADRDGIRIEIDASLRDDRPVTRLRWAVRITLPLRYRLFESMAAPQVRQAAATDLESLRRRLEAVA